MLSLTSGTAANQPELENLAAQLKRWGLSPLAASLLEAAGPFALIAAQSLYVAEPMLSGLMPQTSLKNIASMLEHPEQSAAFAQTLRENK